MKGDKADEDNDYDDNHGKTMITTTRFVEPGCSNKLTALVELRRINQRKMSDKEDKENREVETVSNVSDAQFQKKANTLVA